MRLQSGNPDNDPEYGSGVRVPCNREVCRPRAVRRSVLLFSVLYGKLPRRALTSLLPLLLCALMAVTAGGLPFHLGFVFLPENAPVVTEGCDKGTCCTSLCYVDQQGDHHCVHMHDDSCDCGHSDGRLDVDQTLSSTTAILPDIGDMLPNLILTGWVFERLSLAVGYDPAIPTPPPQ